MTDTKWNPQEEDFPQAGAHTPASLAREEHPAPCAPPSYDPMEETYEQSLWRAGGFTPLRPGHGQAPGLEEEPALPLRFSQVEYEPPAWVIEPYLPAGKLTIIQGDSGVGKTALICALAGLVSTGGALLGCPVVRPGNVLMLSVEDDPSTLRGRIEASGGDASRCFFLERAAGLTFTDEAIAQAVAHVEARLVVFDPLQAFLGGRVDMHRANETRPVLARLGQMAKENDCAVAIVSHMNKAQAGSKAIYRALGSVDIPAAARSVLHVARNPADLQECVIAHIKSSNARAGESIAYTIGERGGVKWRGFSALTVDELETPVHIQKPLDYDREPLVQLFRALLAQKEEGGFWQYETLKTEGQRILGFAPFGDSRELRTKLSAALTSELQAQDGIIVSTGVKRNGLRGIVIERYVVPKEYQTSIEA